MGRMRISLLGGCALLLAGSLAGAQTITFQLQDSAEFPATAGMNFIGEWSNSDDSDPNCLGITSTGAYVFFESEPTAAPGADSLIHYNPSAPGTFASRFTVIASMAQMQTLAGIVDEIRMSDVAVGANDDVYAVYTAGIVAPVPYFLIRIPSTGANTYGAPILMADSTRMGTSTGTGILVVAVDGSTVYFSKESNVVADDVALNGIYSLPTSATNTTAPTLIATHGAQVASQSGVPGTDKGFATDIQVLPGGDLLVSNGRLAAFQRGDIHRLVPGTGTYSLWVDAQTTSGTPDTGLATYNAARGVVGVLWYVGMDATTGADDDRIDEYTTAGALLGTVVTEDPIIAASLNGAGFPPNVTANLNVDIDVSGGAFASGVGGQYAMFTSNTAEFLVRIDAAGPPSVADWTVY